MVVAAIPVANRRVRAERKRLEEVVVIELINNGKMGENSPISSIVSNGFSNFISVTELGRYGVRVLSVHQMGSLL